MRVKCLPDGELPAGRRVKARGAHIASHCLRRFSHTSCCVRFRDSSGRSARYHADRMKMQWHEHTNPSRSNSKWPCAVTVQVLSEPLPEFCKGGIFMKKLLALISESYHEFKNVSTVTTCAMFGAMSVVLGYYSIRVTPNLKIGLGALPNELVDYLFGPVVGCLFGGAMDVVKYLIKPDGGFMFGFTFNAMLAAFIYGLFLYKRPLSLRRMLAAKLVVIVLCNIILGTYWLSLLNGKGYLAILPARIIKNLIQWPVDSLLFILVAKALEQAGAFRLICHGKRR